MYGTKLTGLANLLGALDVTQLRHVVLFSSLAGFHGNAAQTDYAMANEALSKLSSRSLTATHLAQQPISARRHSASHDTPTQQSSDFVGALQSAVEHARTRALLCDDEPLCTRAANASGYGVRESTVGVGEREYGRIASGYGVSGRRL